MKNQILKKLLSVKTWITLWSMAVVTYIIFANRTDFNNIAQWLSTVPLAYLGVNVWQKKILTNKENEEKKE